MTVMMQPGRAGETKVASKARHWQGWTRGPAATLMRPWCCCLCVWCLIGSWAVLLDREESWRSWSGPWPPPCLPPPFCMVILLLLLHPQPLPAHIPHNIRSHRQAQIVQANLPARPRKKRGETAHFLHNPASTTRCLSLTRPHATPPPYNHNQPQHQQPLPCPWTKR